MLFPSKLLIYTLKEKKKNHYMSRARDQRKNMIRPAINLLTLVILLWDVV